MKTSIRFYNNHEARAVRDDDNAKWWFSATDVVRAINNKPNYVKAGNYWRWLKKKLNKEGVEYVSVTHDFKFNAPDGIKCAADVLDVSGVQMLAKNELLRHALTDKIDVREVFMKGVDYSFYYEKN